MMRNDPVLDRLKVADPSPSGSPEPEIVLRDRALRSLVDERIGTVSTELNTESRKQMPTKSPRRWGVVILSAAAVLLIGLPIALIGFPGMSGESENPATSDGSTAFETSNVEVVDSFFDDWNRASYSEALDHLGAGVVILGRAWSDSEWRSFMEYFTAIGMHIEAECAATDDGVRCEIDRIDALDGLTPAESKGTMIFGVADGLITSFTLPTNRTSQDDLAEFAKEASPANYASACSPAAGSVAGGPGSAQFAFNAACGTYLAIQVESYVEALSQVELVDAYFKAWNLGDLEAAASLQHADFRVNGSPAGDNWFNFMEFTAEFGDNHEVSCEPSILGPTCAWIWDAAFANAQETENVGAANLQFRVSDGKLSSFPTPSYGLFEKSLVAFARAADDAGFTSACSADGVSITGTSGAVFHQACGAFLASHVNAFVVSLN